MNTWIERLRRLTPTEYATAAEAIAIAVWIEAALRVMPFSWLIGHVRHPGTQNVQAQPDALKRLPSFVAAAYELLPFPDTCLRKSLVLSALLKRRRVPARVCLGVARNGSALEAHAWVECDGMERDATVLRFRELPAI